MLFPPHEEIATQRKTVAMKLERMGAMLAGYVAIRPIPGHRESSQIVVHTTETVR